MESKELVSIIVPIYNSEQYLEACLDSILAQTYTNLDIILIDDGSIDASGAICDAYAEKDHRIRVFHNTNHGVSYSRNYGIKKSYGEHLIFVDSDDEINNVYIEKIMEKAYEGDLVIASILDVYINKNREKYRKLPLENLSYQLNKDYWRLNGLMNGPWGKLYKKSILLKNKVFFPVELFNWGEDRFFNYRYYQFVQTYAIAREACYRYFHRETMSLSKNDKMIDNFIINKKILREYKNFLWKKQVIRKEMLLCDQCLDFWMYAGSGYSFFEKRCQIINGFINKKYSASNWKRMLVLKCLQYRLYSLIYLYYRMKYLLHK